MPIFPADDEQIAQAAARLQAGELIAFPTETVYGLGANALDAQAVAKIYAAKGRPSFNPLIVHVADKAEARKLVSQWNERAEILADAFWPGPLTLVLPKAEAIPDIVSAGLDTVAIRVPAEPVAQQLLRQVQLPLAAPSANASGEVSPTRAAHVLTSLGEETWVLDGGECAVGIESTVVDVSKETPSILRPGMIGETEIRALIGPLTPPSAQGNSDKEGSTAIDESPRPSPGMLLRHYSPRARVHIFPNLTEAHFHAVLWGAGQKIGVVAFAPTRLEATREVILPMDAANYARQIYALLREFDEEGIDLILLEEVPPTPAWGAIQDRLLRASEREAPAPLELPFERVKF
jgi:L-threonylcarbamoyladenylate synthase